MKTELLTEYVDRLMTQRNTALVTAGVIAVSNLILVGAFVMKSEKTILVPPQITKTLWVGGGEVSREYLEEMALWMSTWLLDMSPSSARFKHDVILKSVVPENYGPLKKQFLDDEEQYKSLQLSTTFKPTQVKAFPETLEAEVKGILSSFMGSEKVDTHESTLKLKFAVRGAGLLLEKVEGERPNAK